MALRTRTRPCDAGARRLEQRGAGTISSRTRSGTSPQFVRPPCKSERLTRSPTPTTRTYTVVGEQLKMIDEVIACVRLLRHRAFGDVLESDVPVEIDHRRHDRLAT